MIARKVRASAIAVILMAGVPAHAQGAAAPASAPTTVQGPAPTAPVPPLVRIAAPAEPDELALYPDVPATMVTENWSKLFGQTIVRNVTRPTITPFLPDPAKATGAAVIVAPGGGFKMLSMDNEGWNVARWLADHGVAAFVLKYRLNKTPEADAAFGAEVIAMFREAAARKGQPIDVREPLATEDAHAALKLVRANAAKWGIDPQRTGMIGFSAGAMTTLNVVTTSKAGQAPSFFGYIYGPMDEISVPEDAPPMFVALAIDDDLFGGQGFGIVDAWQKAGRPVELHAYEKGGHGFGIGKPGTTTPMLMDEFAAWLGARGILTKQ
jgi:acetyl esterase/lipase